MNDETKTEKVIEEFSKRELGDVKVLMVEDDTFFSELVLSKLSKDGCVPYSTGNGSEAIELARQYKPSIIILDLMLPGVSGEEILETLKADSELKAIPVLVFSNKSAESEIKNSLALGAAEHMIKSTTDLNALTEIVRKVVKESV